MFAEVVSYPKPSSNFILKRVRGLSMGPRVARISQEGKYNNLTTDALQYATLLLGIAARRRHENMPCVEQDVTCFFESFVVLYNRPYATSVRSVEP
jgi:hypothetical protein